MVLPPDFDDLPEPFDKSAKAVEIQIEDDIEKLLGMEDVAMSESETSDSSTIESFVLKKIKEN